MTMRFMRRRFLSWLGRAAAVVTCRIATFDAAATASAPDAGEQGLLFRFVQWNDTHADVTEPPAYALANDKVRHLVESLNASTLFPVPAFIIHCGDMIHGENLASLGPDLTLFKDLIAGVKCPVYPVVGNHEVVQREGDPQFLAAYRQVFGEGRTNYSFRHRGLQFVVIDNSGVPGSNGTEVARSRNRWLSEILAGSKGVPTIVCCHVPLVPVRDEEVLKKSFGFTSYASHDEELLKLIDRHADSIVAVLSGHLHLTGAVCRKGVYHVSIAGSASYPCDFASFEVYPDRIRMKVHSLPPHLVTPETAIHGKQRHGRDFTDAGHATAETYVMGNPDERSIDMPLPRRL